MKLTQNEAYLILSDLDKYVARFEEVTNKKVTPGAMQIIQEMLTEASFPEKGQTAILH